MKRHFKNFDSHKVYMAYPFCFNGNSSLNIVASFTTALYAWKIIRLLVLHSISLWYELQRFNLLSHYCNMELIQFFLLAQSLQILFSVWEFKLYDSIPQQTDVFLFSTIIVVSFKQNLARDYMEQIACLKSWDKYKVNSKHKLLLNQTLQFSVQRSSSNLLYNITELNICNLMQHCNRN